MLIICVLSGDCLLMMSHARAGAAGDGTCSSCESWWSGGNCTISVWTTKVAMPTVRHGLASSVVNGKIYAIGGGYYDGSDDVFVGTVEEYDSALDTWTTKTPMPTVRGDLTSSVVNGKIYAIGGYDGSEHLGTVEESPQIQE
jgi:hypothetical protein